ncbi:hypothetical protein H4R34_002553 [Dimargaris verticillata]|uniref:Zn(2)-C6 fungal-type domain-containing protein n=1 Tax=Dimargaris verticillata TaxID=2761393 RepID=A0A9W8B7T2_9FUNG|nr:hypothetical protein H4R34_002553 [Dimargaris verticillata]
MRFRRACDSCSARKVRCDGQVPCAGCTAKGSICHYRPAYQTTLKTSKANKGLTGFNVLIPASYAAKSRASVVVDKIATGVILLPDCRAQTSNSPNRRANAVDPLPTSPTSSPILPPTAATPRATLPLDAAAATPVMTVHQRLGEGCNASTEFHIDWTGQPQMPSWASSWQAVSLVHALPSYEDVLFSRKLVFSVCRYYYEKTFGPDGAAFFEHFWEVVLANRLSPFVLNCILAGGMRFIVEFHRETQFDVAKMISPYVQNALFLALSAMEQPALLHVAAFKDLASALRCLGDFERSSLFAAIPSRIASCLRLYALDIQNCLPSQAKDPTMPQARYMRNIQRDAYWRQLLLSCYFSLFELVSPTVREAEYCVDFPNYRQAARDIKQCLDASTVDATSLPPILPTNSCCTFRFSPMASLIKIMFSVARFTRQRFVGQLTVPTKQLQRIVIALETWFEDLPLACALPKRTQAEAMARHCPATLGHLLSLHAHYYATWILAHIRHPYGCQLATHSGEPHPTPPSPFSDLSTSLSASPPCTSLSQELFTPLRERELFEKALEAADTARLTLLPLCHLLSPRDLDMGISMCLFWFGVVYLQACAQSKDDQQARAHAHLLQVTSVLSPIGYYWPTAKRLNDYLLAAASHPSLSTSRAK